MSDLRLDERVFLEYTKEEIERGKRVADQVSVSVFFLHRAPRMYGAGKTKRV